LGKKPKDIDYVFVGNMAKLKQYLSKNNYKIFLINEDCFTIRAKNLTTNITEDFVLARKEYEYNGRTPECDVGTLYDDLIRRDFTINSMCINTDGDIIDYFGGQNDLKNKILRTPTDPYKSFNDDPLRLIRAIRFNITLNMTFSPELECQFYNKDHWQKLKTCVSIERIREEFRKCFAFNTISTLRLLAKIDNIDSTIIEYIFGDKLWLNPTTAKV
jgi:tRNA nucleotidyltransferase/poly(A) polymerase